MMTNPHNLPKLTLEQYYDLYTGFIVPLDITINVSDFKQQIQQFSKYFRVWGNTHLDWPRYGIPLCNLTGRLDDEVDPSCWPLDKWWKEYPDQFYWDNDFKTQTEVLQLSSLDPLSYVRPYMVRSNILKWDTDGQFVPHIDTVPDLITHIRIWGTTESPSDYELKFGNTIIDDFEPGRLYLIDTIATHSARSLCDNAYTFFITLSLDALETVQQLRLV